MYTPTMTLRNAATFAFLGTLLLTALLVWNFVFYLVNVIQGLTPVAGLLSLLIQAFAALSLAVFFYVFRNAQR